MCSLYLNVHQCNQISIQLSTFPISWNGMFSAPCKMLKSQTVTNPVYPTHRLYINGRPIIFGDTFLFLLLLLSLTLFFLSIRDNETIRDRLTTTIHHPLPSAPASLTHEHNFSTIFSNFQNILAAFFHNRYILTTNLATL